MDLKIKKYFETNSEYNQFFNDITNKSEEIEREISDFLYDYMCSNNEIISFFKAEEIIYEKLYDTLYDYFECYCGNDKLTLLQNDSKTENEIINYMFGIVNFSKSDLNDIIENIRENEYINRFGLSSYYGISNSMFI